MISIPEEQIKEIAQEINCGFECFIHKQTGECIKYPTDYEFDDTGSWDDLVKLVKKNPDQYLHVEPPSARDSFRIMENFAYSLNERDHVRARLIEALQKPKPFQHFKHAIDNSGTYRQLWFTFKDQQLENFVRRQLIHAADKH